MNYNPTQNKKQSILLFIGILTIAFNLRPALASLGPLVESIRKDTHLSSLFLGLLTTLPLLVFGVISIFAPKFIKQFGIGKILFAALFILTIGILVRSLDWIPALYIGTVLAGVGIAFGNVLLPTLTKRNFSANSGLVTSLYSSTMAIGATIAAGVSVPLAYNFDFGWRGSLSVWAIFSMFALVIWLPQWWKLKKVESTRNALKEMQKMMKKPLAWKISLYMGLQSFTFYVILAWLPALLVSRGFDNETAGWILSLSQATGIIGSLTIPYLAGKKENQTWIVVFLIVLEVISIIGLLFPVLGSEWIWISIIGFVLGGTFGLSLLFLVIRTSSTDSATELSGMAQSIGYFIAATGPILIGSIFDWTGSWDYPLMLLVLIAVVKLFMGLGAAKPQTV